MQLVGLLLCDELKYVLRNLLEGCNGQRMSGLNILRQNIWLG